MHRYMFYIHSDLQSLCSKSVSRLSSHFNFPGVNNKIFTFCKNTMLLTFGFLINTDTGLYKSSDCFQGHSLKALSSKMIFLGKVLDDHRQERSLGIQPLGLWRGSQSMSALCLLPARTLLISGKGKCCRSVCVRECRFQNETEAEGICLRFVKLSINYLPWLPWPNKHLLMHI